MSTINPPEYQQSPPQPPPLPPHRSWPRHHKILTALGAVFSLLVVLIIVIAATSAPSVTRPSTPATTAAAPATSAQATTTPTPVAPSLTAAQQKFITDMTAQYSLGTGTSSGNADVVAVGNEVCTSSSPAHRRAASPAKSSSPIPDVRQQRRRGRQPRRPRPLPAAAAQAKAAAAPRCCCREGRCCEGCRQGPGEAKIAAENTPISAAQ